MRKVHAKSVERDGNEAPETDPRAQVVLERIARCGYMIDRHREGIAINSRRIAELQAELERLEAQP